MYLSDSILSPAAKATIPREHLRTPPHPPCPPKSSPSPPPSTSAPSPPARHTPSSTSTPRGVGPAKSYPRSLSTWRPRRASRDASPSAKWMSMRRERLRERMAFLRKSRDTRIHRQYGANGLRTARDGVGWIAWCAEYMGMVGVAHLLICDYAECRHSSY